MNIYPAQKWNRQDFRRGENQRKVLIMTLAYCNNVKRKDY